MQKFLRLFAYLIFGAVFLVACDDDDDNDNPSPNPGGGGSTVDLSQGNAGLTVANQTVGGVDLVSIEGEITGNFTIAAGAKYWLNNSVFVKDGATLTIGAGATIYGNPEASGSVPAFLAVEQGAKINADGGNAGGVITLTSGRTLVGGTPESGDWGGLIIAGRGILNTTNGGGGSGIVEGTNLPYGGTDNADNSGTLRYVRVEYAGASITAEEDMNGIAFYGVGSGTTVEYVQVYKGADDGVEFYGGAVNAKYLVITDAKDDQIDYTQGWQGKLQYAIAVTSSQGDNGFECDNFDGGVSNEPFSQPKVSNVTVVNYNNAAGGRGLRLRNGTKGNFHNVLVVDHKTGVQVNGDVSQSFDASGELVFANSVIVGTGTKIDAGDNSKIAVDTTNVTLETLPISIANDFVGVMKSADGAKPVNAKTALDSFFDATDYVGAADPSGATWWTGGWIRSAAGDMIQ